MWQLRKACLHFLLHKAEGLAGLREILVFICETLKARRICFYTCCNRVSCQVASGPSSLPSTGDLVFTRLNPKPSFLNNFVFDLEIHSRAYDVGCVKYGFPILSTELIKCTLFYFVTFSERTFQKA